MERRLSAIFAADMVGYSRLMEADEVGTLQRQKTHRAELINPTLEEFHGRIVKEMGDGILVEFPSVVEAVQCAVAIQREMVDREADVSGDRRIVYRIGVNLGDIVIEDEDIFGDGVNVAARLEQLADPGGICISGTAYDHLISKVEVGYESLGNVQVKNIDRPIRAYKVLTDPDQAGEVIEEKQSGVVSIKKLAVITTVLLVAIIGGGAWWWSQQPDFEPADPKKFAFTIPENPSIAVLPFANMSNEKEQEYFVDGLTDDLITDLSKLSGLFVISRNSTFTYKGKSVKARQVAQEFGVRYVLDGSVRRSGGQVRINVQLIDALSGYHLWAERYDRKLKDIFSLQDEVIENIVSALSLNLTPDEKKLITKKGTEKFEAFDLYMRGREQEGFFNKEANIAARELYENAIALDPNYAEAYARLSVVYEFDAQFGWNKNSDEAYNKSLEMAERAVNLNRDLPFAHFALGRTLIRPLFAQYDRAIGEMQQAITLDPNYADAYAYLGLIYVYTGNTGKALGLIENAMRINPNFPFWYYYSLGMAQFAMTNYQAAVKNLTFAMERNPSVIFVRYSLTAALAKAGRKDDAAWELGELRTLGVTGTLQEEMDRSLIRDAATRRIFFEGLRSAGLE